MAFLFTKVFAAPAITQFLSSEVVEVSKILKRNRKWVGLAAAAGTAVYGVHCYLQAQASRLEQEYEDKAHETAQEIDLLSDLQRSNVSFEEPGMAAEELIMELEDCLEVDIPLVKYEQKDEVRKERKAVHKKMVPTAVRALAIFGKNRFNNPSTVPAQVEAVYQTLVRHCNKLNIRQADINKIVPKALSLVYMPTDGQVEMATFLRSAAFLSKKALVDKKTVGSVFSRWFNGDH